MNIQAITKLYHLEPSEKTLTSACSENSFIAEIAASPIYFIFSDNAVLNTEAVIMHIAAMVKIQKTEPINLKIRTKSLLL